MIDDDQIYCYLAKTTLEKTNLINEIKFFPNGLAAINYFKEIQDKGGVKPEIIFLDLAMPIMDGWEFLEEFEKLHDSFRENINLFIVSSSISPADIQRAATFNFVKNYLVKPITAEKTINCIKEISKE